MNEVGEVGDGFEGVVDLVHDGGGVLSGCGTALAFAERLFDLDPELLFCDWSGDGDYFLSGKLIQLD